MRADIRLIVNVLIGAFLGGCGGAWMAQGASNGNWGQVNAGIMCFLLLLVYIAVVNSIVKVNGRKDG